MELLALPDGAVSLEFRSFEALIVAARLRAAGELTVTDHAVHQVIMVGDVELIHYHEWSEPCLIGSAGAAATLLRVIVTEAFADD